jgi:uncharacterized delta-60 repeat protein
MPAHFVSRRGEGNLGNNSLRSAVAPVIERLERRALMAAGQLDPTFGGGAPVVTHVSDLGATFTDVVVQADGKILAAGTTAYGQATADFLLVRYHANGTIDDGFGVNGVVVTNLGAAAQEQSAGVAVAANGMIYLAGTASSGVGGAQFALLRYLGNGQLDTSFGAGGVVFAAMDPAGVDRVASGTKSQCADMVMQSDGKLLLAGSYVNGNAAFAVARFNADGSLDTTFASGGKIVVDLGAGDDYAKSVAIAPDLGIVMGGMSQQGGSLAAALVRVTYTGKLDTAFGTGGASVATTGGWNQQVEAIAIQPNGKIVTAGVGASEGMAVMRFDSGGAVDTTFGYGGVSTVNVKGTGYDDRGYAVALQPDGRIVVAGIGTSAVAVGRLGYDGAEDRTFNGGWGYITLPLAPNTSGVAGRAHAMAFQPDGNIVVAGHSGNAADPVVFRLERGPAASLPPDTYITLNGSLVISGTNGNDVILLELREWLEGGPGADPLMKVTINGKESDWIDPWFVRQMIVQAGAGDDIVVVGAGVGSVELFGFGQYGNMGVYISGGDGNDRLVGGDYADTISGNANKDRIDGGYGDDRLAGNGGNDAITGSAGRDRIYGDNGDDRIEAGSQNDRIWGGDGADLLGGGSGSDSLYGGQGDDTLAGGSGSGTDKAYDVVIGHDWVSGVNIITVNPIILGASLPPSLLDGSTRLRDLDALLA